MINVCAGISATHEIAVAIIRTSQWSCSQTYIDVGDASFKITTLQSEFISADTMPAFSLWLIQVLRISGATWKPDGRCSAD